MCMNCKFCNREFVRKCALIIHEKACKLNTTEKITYNIKKQNYICPFCKRIKFTSKSGNNYHIRFCKKNPNMEKHIITDETRLKLSNSLKLAIKDGRAKGWASSKQNKNGMSYPEIWFEKVVENENLDKNYEYNKQFFQYKIDFAWVNKKLAFEIDGEQHNLKERIESDIKKDAKLKEFGWKVLRLKWSYIYNNTKEFIKIIKDFLNETGNINVPNWKSKTEIKNENREKKNKIIYKKWLDRKELILKSGVDFSKYGWKTKVEKITNLTKREIENTIKHFKEDFKNCYKRK